MPSAGFTDVAGNTHAASIDCVAWWQVTTGVSADRYAPGLVVRRDQMASFLARAILASGGTLPPADAHPGFADTVGNSHEQAIRRLAAAGVVAGTSASNYGPAGGVRRDQLATFLVRGYEHRTGQPLPPGQSRFTDTAGNVHRANIDKAAEAGFTSGVTPTSYQPVGLVRRDQMASFVARTLDRLVTHGHTHPPDRR